MKILLVNDYGTVHGGAEVATRTLREGLRRKGQDARLFVSSAAEESSKPDADYICFGTVSRFRTLVQTANPWSYWSLRRVLAEFQPEVVHVGLFLTQLSPSILLLLREVPSLLYAHWYRPICPLGTKILPDGTACRVPAGTNCYSNGCLPKRDWLPLVLQMQLWWRQRSVFDQIVANSEATKRRLIEGGLHVASVIYPGVPLRAARPPLASPPTVVFAGRLIRQKGADVLLRAFAGVVRVLPEARLVVAGDGAEREKLENMIRDLGLAPSVAMMGHLPGRELEKRLACGWVQAVPSRIVESFGLAAAEAMMRGTAVVASAVDGLGEIVRDGRTGLLVPAGDVEALQEMLLHLLRDRHLAERMGRAGREVALRDFEDSLQVERFLCLYETLLQA